MVLSKLLEGVRVSKMFQTLYGKMVVTHDVEVRNIQYDSRQVERGDMFVAIRGVASDGHRHVFDAIAAGAKVVLIENETSLPDSYFMHTGVVKIVVPDTRIALAGVSANYYSRPSDQLVMVGVTGTNGKTTTTHLIRQLLEADGKRSGMIGTIDYCIGEELIPATHTTPESLELNGLMRKMVDRDCKAAVMEVSSHALHQHRVEGINFAAAVFTNLTQDHLDYHGTMENYFEAKKQLFTNLSSEGWAIVNADDLWGARIAATAKAQILTYGVNQQADVRAKDLVLSMNGSALTVLHQSEETHLESQLVGRFNVSNILAAFATGIALGVPKSKMQSAIQSMPPVKGRFEPILSNRGWTAIVDYAHTPDALEKALAAVRDVISAKKQGRVITVFGCGGNRDRTKRPVMAAVALRLSDLTIVTSDNPRHEDPERIIDEVMTEVPENSAVRRETDRKSAIILALSLAQPGDVILVAGKGHENYQILGDKKLHFSDREVIEEYLASH